MFSIFLLIIFENKFLLGKRKEKGIRDFGEPQETSCTSEVYIHIKKLVAKSDLEIFIEIFNLVFILIKFLDNFFYKKYGLYCLAQDSNKIR